MQSFVKNTPFKILLVTDSRPLYGKALNSLRAQLGTRFMLHPFSDFVSASWNHRTSASCYDLVVADSAGLAGDGLPPQEAREIQHMLSEVPGMFLLHKGEDDLAEEAMDLGFKGFCFIEPDFQFRRLFPALTLKIITHYRELRNRITHRGESETSRVHERLAATSTLVEA